MDRAPRFSIITACLNAEKTLPRTLQSLRAQEFRDFEVVIVDGGSTDGTMDIVRAHADVVKQSVSEKDKGISDAFNKGVRMARGDYVAHLNADDWYEPGTLARVSAAVDASRADVICGHLRYAEEDGRTGAVFGARPELLRQFMSINHMATWARRGLFEQHGGFRTDMRAAMDYELFLRFHVRGATFHVVDDVLANMSLGGVSDRHWRRALDEVRTAQRLNGVDAAHAWGHWAFARAKGEVRRVLDRTGGGALVRLYRERVARVRKVQG